MNKTYEVQEDEVISPQPGPQTMLLACEADIAFYGGAAGGGKTFGLLLDYSNHTEDKNNDAVFFRRTTPQITAIGGPWEVASDLYAKLGAIPKEGALRIVFSSGATMKFTHLENEKDKLNHQGGQYPILYFDELSHFSESQFWYVTSRNRSSESSVMPYVRATTNPDPDSWVADFISWWIDPDTGFAIPERSGVIRFFYRFNNQVYWADSKEELKEKFPHLAKTADPRSFTFIPSLLDDNKILMENDPSYKATLLALKAVDKERLLFGNWKIREDSGDYFKRDYFSIINKEDLPGDRLKVRFWDRAGTSAKEISENKAKGITQARTASVLLSFSMSDKTFYIEDVTNDLLSPKQVVEKMTKVVVDDGLYVTVGLSQDPGQAGKFELEFYKERFGNYHVWTTKETGSKESRAKPVSAQAEKGMIKLVLGSWNEEFIKQAENFPSGLKDIIDALSGAFAYFVENKMAALDVYGSSGHSKMPSVGKSKNLGYDNIASTPVYETGRIQRNNW